MQKNFSFIYTALLGVKRTTLPTGQKWFMREEFSKQYFTSWRRINSEKIAIFALY